MGERVLTFFFSGGFFERSTRGPSAAAAQRAGKRLGIGGQASCRKSCKGGACAPSMGAPRLNKRERHDAASPGTARQAQAVVDSVPSRPTLPSCVGEMGASCRGSTPAGSN